MNNLKARKVHDCNANNNSNNLSNKVIFQKSTNKVVSKANKRILSFSFILLIYFIMLYLYICIYYDLNILLNSIILPKYQCVCNV